MDERVLWKGRPEGGKGSGRGVFELGAGRGEIFGLMGVGEDFGFNGLC